MDAWLRHHPVFNLERAYCLGETFVERLCQLFEFNLFLKGVHPLCEFLSLLKECKIINLSEFQ